MRPARAVAAFLALALAVVAVETAIHSVHHLGDHLKPSSCVLQAAGQHVVGTPIDVAELAVPTGAIEGLPAAAHEDPLPRLPVRPHEGRAPPASPFVEVAPALS